MKTLPWRRRGSQLKPGLPHHERGAPDQRERRRRWGPDGLAPGCRRVGCYTPLQRPDGTGKMYSINDAEGREIDLSYGSDFVQRIRDGIPRTGGPCWHSDAQRLM